MKGLAWKRRLHQSILNSGYVGRHVTHVLQPYKPSRHTFGGDISESSLYVLYNNTNHFELLVFQANVV